jgi:hypothetical protein
MTTPCESDWAQTRVQSAQPLGYILGNRPPTARDFQKEVDLKEHLRQQIQTREQHRREEKEKERVVVKAEDVATEMCSSLFVANSSVPKSKSTRRW